MADAGKNNRVTIRTVAADAGVSVAAVSKVLRNAYGVSNELRAKVHASVARLRYRPRPAARAMRGLTYTIGVLLPDIHNPFFSDIVDGINAALERTQYRTLFGISRSSTIVELAVIDFMIDWQMDGVIIVGPRVTREDAESIGSRIPAAMIAHHDSLATHFDTVNNNDQLGARLVVEHLAATGRKRIAFLTLPDLGSVAVTNQRETGYLAVMRDAGLGRHAQVVRADQSPRDVQIATRQMLSAPQRPDAIFCWTDFIAFEVLSVARGMGFKVPEELAVVGYDNTEMCELTQNSLTSIDQSGQVLGLQAARLVIERIKGREHAEHFVVTPRLVVRGSTERKPGAL